MTYNIKEIDNKSFGSNINFDSNFDESANTVTLFVSVLVNGGYDN